MTVSAATITDKLPVPVLEHPHWRVNFRPSVYAPDRMDTLTECVDVLNKTRVRLRGWDFPYMPSREVDFNFGDTWVAAWSDFMGHLEYWRFYQSTQFLYLGSVREVTEPTWTAKIRDAMEWHAHGRVDIGTVPGFLSVVECIYNITEYFEFGARLAQAEIYRDAVTITISLKGVEGFMLAAEKSRMWSADYVAKQSQLQYAKIFAPADLISSAAENALACTVWLFERFGWLKPNIDAIRSDQQKLLTRAF